jgi:2-haloacid dehalogenase
MPHVFDVYGTLLDVDAAAREAAAAPGMESLAASWPQLAAAWRQRQLSYSWLRTTMQRYTDFWTITQNALDVTMAEMDMDDAQMRERLLSLYTTLTAYDEVPGVLQQLAAGGQGTGVLSNGSPAMLDSALAAAGIAGSLDHVLSVDVLRLYKPDPAVYRLVTDAFGCSASEVTFYSSNNWDVAGAGSFGFRTIWVNRVGKPWDDLPEPPAHQVASLAEAMTLL